MRPGRVWIDSGRARDMWRLVLKYNLSVHPIASLGGLATSNSMNYSPHPFSARRPFTCDSEDVCIMKDASLFLTSSFVECF